MEMANRRNYYRLLLVQPDAPLEVIKSNYHILLQKLRMHPDLGGDAKHTRELNRAYSTLKSSDKRAHYDKQLRRTHNIDLLSQGALKRTARHCAPLFHHERSGNPNRRHYYRVLHIQPDASQSMIEASYKKLVVKTGADTQLLTKAYRVLSQPHMRYRYDTWRITGIPMHRQTPAVTTHACHSKPTATESGLVTTCRFCNTTHLCDENHEFCCECNSPLRSPFHGYQPPQEGGRNLWRINKGGELSFYTVWPGEKQPAQLADLSPKGMKLYTEQTLKQGQVIKIDSQNFKAVGSITHILHTKGQHTVGVHFFTVKFTQARGSFISTQI